MDALIDFFYMTNAFIDFFTDISIRTFASLFAIGIRITAVIHKNIQYKIVSCRK